MVKCTINEECKKIIINDKVYYRQDAKQAPGRKKRTGKHKFNIRTRLWHVYMKQNMKDVKTIIKLLNGKNFELGSTISDFNPEKLNGLTQKPIPQPKCKVNQDGQKGKLLNKQAMCVLGANFQQEHNVYYLDHYNNQLTQAQQELFNKPRPKGELEDDNLQTIIEKFPTYFDKALTAYEKSERTAKDIKALGTAIKWQIIKKTKLLDEQVKENIQNLLQAWDDNTTFAFDGMSVNNQEANLEVINGVLQEIETPEAKANENRTQAEKDEDKQKGNYTEVSLELMNEKDETERLNELFKNLCTKSDAPLDKQETWPDEDNKYTIKDFDDYKNVYVKDATYKVFLVNDGAKEVGILILKKLYGGRGRNSDIQYHLDRHETKMTKAENDALKSAIKKKGLHGISIDVVCARNKFHLGKYLVAIGKLYADHVKNNVLTTLEATSNKLRQDEAELYEHYNSFMPDMGFKYIEDEKFYHVPKAEN